MTDQFDTLVEETADAIEQFNALAERVKGTRADQVEAGDSIAKRPIISGTMPATFLFDQEIARGPGFVQFGSLTRSSTGAPSHEAYCMMQWGSALLYPGENRVDFALPFEGELTDIAGGNATSEPSHPWVIHDADLAGFWIYCEAPRVISYLAWGR